MQSGMIISSLLGKENLEQFLQDAKTLGVKIECLGSLPKNEVMPIYIYLR